MPPAPSVTWLLLGGAAVDVIVQFLARGYPLSSLTPGIALGVFASAMFFVLAAAALIGAPGWSAGRIWLIAGAALFAAAGFIDLGFWAWAWTQPGGHGLYPVISEPNAWLVQARGNAGAAATAGAPLLVAVGMWLARPPDQRIGPARQGLLAGVALIGLTAAGGFIALATRTTPSLSLIGNLAYSLYALGGLTMAGLAMAAVAALPSVGWLPETLIAIGALLETVARGAMGWLGLVSSPSGPPGWLLTTVTALDGVVLVAFVLLAGGLALGRLVAPASTRNS
jgi:hypothetical protein